MDSSHFDFIARAAHTTPSRRKFFAGLAGAATAIVAGRAGVDQALAQGLSAQKYDLVCKQSGVTYFCVDGQAGDPSMNCNGSKCKCARKRQNDGRVCVAEPETDKCPKDGDVCREDSDCRGDLICIKIPACCPNHPGRGICARRCGE